MSIHSCWQLYGNPGIRHWSFINHLATYVKRWHRTMDRSLQYSARTNNFNCIFINPAPSVSCNYSGFKSRAFAKTEIIPYPKITWSVFTSPVVSERPYQLFKSSTLYAEARSIANSSC